LPAFQGRSDIQCYDLVPTSQEPDGPVGVQEVWHLSFDGRTTPTKSPLVHLSNELVGNDILPHPKRGKEDRVIASFLLKNDDLDHLILGKVHRFERFEDAHLIFPLNYFAQRQPLLRMQSSVYDT